MSTTVNAAPAHVGSEPLLLEVDDLVQRYTLPRENLFQPAPQVLALNGVSVQLTAGQEPRRGRRIRLGQIHLRARW